MFDCPMEGAPSARVLLLGANGLIGSAVAARLMARGYEVIGVGRDIAAARIAMPGMEWLARDLRRMTRPEQWPPLLAGVTAVVNCAGALQDSPRDDLSAVHLGAPLALYEACAALGLRRVIHVSAAGTSAHRDTAFSRTKFDMEEALARLDLDWLILRPGLVIAPGAYGGSALLRALAAFPFVIPAVHASARVQIVSLDDLAATILLALEPGAPARQTFDLLHHHNHGMADILRALRQWLGLSPAPTLNLPPWLAAGCGLCADALAYAGWRSPMRSTSLAQLHDGIEGDGAPWAAAFAIHPKSLQSILAEHPAGVQERWFARLYLLKPLALATLVLFWAASGLIGAAQVDGAAGILVAVGWPEGAARAAVLTGAALDLGLAFLVMRRSTAPMGLIGMAAASIAYLLAGALARPDLWLDPLGPYLKVAPGLALTLLTLAIMDER